MEEDEISFFKDLMVNKKPGTKMVEWGSGGSTMMFLPYFSTGKLISVEHNPEWWDKVVSAIGDSGLPKETLDNFLYCFIPPTYMGGVVNPSFYGYGVPFEENPCFASRYIDPETGDTKIWDSDIYFVDGICRGPILATIAVKARNRDADIFVHDYYGPENREGWYNWASCMYGSVEKVGTTLARLKL